MLARPVALTAQLTKSLATPLTVATATQATLGAKRLLAIPRLAVIVMETLGIPPDQATSLMAVILKATTFGART
jgi:hypothetical protein